MRLRPLTAAGALVALFLALPSSAQTYEYRQAVPNLRVKAKQVLPAALAGVVLADSVVLPDGRVVYADHSANLWLATAEGAIIATVASTYYTAPSGLTGLPYNYLSEDWFFNVPLLVQLSLSGNQVSMAVLSTYVRATYNAGGAARFHSQARLNYATVTAGTAALSLGSTAHVDLSPTVYLEGYPPPLVNAVLELSSDATTAVANYSFTRQSVSYAATQTWAVGAN